MPVLIDPGMGVKNLGACLAEAEPEAFIGIPKAHARPAAPRLGAATRSGSRVTTGRRLFGWQHIAAANSRQIGERLGPLPVADTRADETAAILFTSGSTGVAKGAVYTHGIFAAQVEYSEERLRHRAGRGRPLARSRCSPCSPRRWG